MKAIFCTAALAVALLFFSCQKEVSVERGPDSPATPTGNDSTVLSMYIELDTLGGTTDTVNKTIFEYDNLKRLVKETSITYNNNVPTLLDDYGRVYYYYNGTDTLASKIIDVFYDEVDITDSVVHFFSRNASQVVTRDSMIYFASYQNTKDTITSTSNFIIYPDSIIDNNRHYTYSVASEIISKEKHIQTKANGNLQTEIRLLDRGTFYEELSRVTVQYDTKHNPFFIRNINFPFIEAPNIDINWNAEKNNPLEYSTVYQGGSASVYKYSYTYNQLGYPKTVVSYDPSFPLEAIKGIYIYTK